VHIPVLQKEVIQYLSPKENENFIDCTAGNGGHTAAILEKNGPKGKVLGIDADPEMVKNLESRISNIEHRRRLIPVCGNFADLKEITKRENFKNISGILLDLGMSSWHLEESGRGFTFQKAEPLDMRYSSQNPLTASKILNFWSEPEIEKILKEYGEERFAKNIAREIIKARTLSSIEDTLQLVKIIQRAIPKRYQDRNRHFATRVFQALRIAVNDELGNLKRVLPQAEEILKKEGRLVVISFHSLEDRIVKNFFRENSNLKIITKKPIRPSQKEIRSNPRSRSSKLRAAEKNR
jgi:16S rRNA (cytosine1402-N4)-methyltransferase